LTPTSVICEILKEDGEMARLPDLIAYAKQHGLKIGTIADLIEYRSQHEKLVERVARRRVQTAYGEFELVTYVDKTTQRTHLALVKGDVVHDAETLVRVHEPLSVMDFLEQTNHAHSISVNHAMQKIGQSPAGVLILLHRGETAQDLRARAALEADMQQTSQWDPRSYGIGAQILRDLNVGKMRLLATPHKMPSMAGFGLEVVGYASHL
ncbi:MAG: 3,4-dihydroxy-2-butanone-4-phosphate synthase, partial [Gallionella sp.]